MSTSPNTYHALLDTEPLQFRPPQPGHPILYSGDPALGQQCVLGRPLCVSSERDSRHARPQEHVISAVQTGVLRFPGPKLHNTLSLSPLLMLSAAAEDDCSLATTCASMLLSKREGDLMFPPLPTCSGAQELAKTTMTSLHGVPRHGGCHQLLRQQADRPLVCSSWPPPHLPHRALSKANVKPCEPPRYPLSGRGGERCFVCDRPNQKTCLQLLHIFASWSVGSLHMTRSLEGTTSDS